MEEPQWVESKGDAQSIGPSNLASASGFPSQSPAYALGLLTFLSGNLAKPQISDDLETRAQDQDPSLEIAQT